MQRRAYPQKCVWCGRPTHNVEPVCDDDRCCEREVAQRKRVS